MRRSRLTSVVVALLAISALGVASTTLETSVTTEPDDEINPNWDRLPIGQGDAATMLEQMGETDEDDGETGAVEGDEESDSESDDESHGDDAEGEDHESGEADEESPGAGGDDGGNQDAGAGSGMDTEGGEPSLLDRLLALLGAILQALLVLALLGAIGAIAYRYREELRALFGSSTEPTAEPVPASDPWPAADPSNVVDRAWLRMVRLVDPERPETTTTGECRALALERGFDRAAVEPIVTAFERVHYGGSSLEEEAERAREGLSRLDGGGE